jgi:hypothetical protein
MNSENGDHSTGDERGMSVVVWLMAGLVIWVCVLLLITLL